MFSTPNKFAPSMRYTLLDFADSCLSSMRCRFLSHVPHVSERNTDDLAEAKDSGNLLSNKSLDDDEFLQGH
jgi:hypothetical protein